MKTLPLSLSLVAAAVCGFCSMSQAQVPDAPAPPPASAPAPGGGSSNNNNSGGDSAARGPGNNFLGKDVPVMESGGDILSWDGKHWNINNNRLFGARFEKYLNAEAETTATDARYRATVQAVLDKLSPYRISATSMDEAFKLLPQASSFASDANLSDALASSIYSVWQARREDARVLGANAALEQEKKVLEWNAQMTTQGAKTDSPPGKNASQAEQQQWQKEQALKRDVQMQPYVTRLAEIKALTTANRAKRELSELQTKVEFQSLIVQFFLQRRFQHVLMATGFYRAIFGDGDTSLKLEGDAKKLFSSTTGMPPTVSVLDSLAKEAIHDAREGVEAYKFLLTKNELESATKRLAEAFMIGEFLPELRTLPRDDKRQVLAFTQKSNQLLSALEVKDYTLAESLVHDLEKTAKDFDNSKPLAAIETARTVAAMHLAKAKNAAVSGDRATVEAELKAATEIWPRNPALSEVSALIFSQADVQGRAIVDFDQLLSQNNYRQIWDDQVRFIAAVAIYPQRQEQLKKVLADMGAVEAALLRSQEIAKRGDYAGAWETVERQWKAFPDDNKLNQARATLTTEAAEFVRTLRTAETMETKGQFGASLAWYLKAQKLYPASDFASEGIARLVKEVLPET
ncbi:MAG: hypothetical protein JO117_01220 [Verrucomicrobia bacterium]|nr:hypothetical protein [Verrucomicrobiota bacterium]